MRKLFAAAAVGLFFCLTATAQKMKGKTFLGFKAGANVSTFRTPTDYPDFDPALKTGISLGTFVEIPVSDKVVIQPEFYYSQMGSRGASSPWGTVRFRYNYFSVPVVLKYRLGQSFAAFIGPEADILIRARKRDQYSTESITYVVRDYDLGFTVGAEAWFSPKVSLAARYIHGTRDVSLNNDHFTFFNQGVQVTVGYKLYSRAKKTRSK